MKYLKGYKIFESDSNFDKEYLIEEIKDLLIDLEDQEFRVFVKLDDSIDCLNVSIYKEEENINTKEDLFNYEDIEYYINRLINYLKDFNYKVKEENPINSRKIINPSTFTPVVRTHFLIRFNKQD